MPNNSTTSSSEAVASFYSQATVCYSDYCSEVDPRWVKDFGDAGNVSPVIVVTGPGERQGVYVWFNNQQWRLALLFDDYVKLCSATNSKITIWVNNQVPDTPIPESASHAFRNAQPISLDTLVYKTDFDIFTFVEEVLAPFDLVTKEGESTKADVIQVSSGPGYNIKDYVPTEAGLIKVDGDGVAAIAEPGVDYSLPSELVAEDFPEDNPEFTEGDPTLKYNVGEETQMTLQLGQLRSGGGLPLGTVILSKE